MVNRLPWSSQEKKKIGKILVVTRGVLALIEDGSAQRPEQVALATGGLGLSYVSLDCQLWERGRRSMRVARTKSFLRLEIS